MEPSLKADIQRRIASEFGAIVKLDEPLSAHTTFRIGGPALAYVTPRAAEEVAAVLKWCLSNGVEHSVIGGGSNLLCDSRGYDGVVIALTDEAFTSVETAGDTVVAGGGAQLRSVVAQSLEAGYTSLGFLGGIPGTLGGAVAMNAGTRNEWIDSFVGSVKGVELSTGEPFRKTHDEISWGYRYSSLRDNILITSVTFARLEKGDVETTRQAMRSALERRKETQPLNLPNAGSIFANPEGHSSGALIEACGLKGFSLGGAQVSEKHANFIVNTGSATSDDVKALIAHIQDEVFSRHGIRLSTEIRFL